jgi:two-component system response regulator DesR
LLACLHVSRARRTRRVGKASDSPLTPREADVLELAAGGTAVEESAQRAAVSPGTVRNYLSSAAAKLGAANRHEAVQLARSRGWI